MNPIDIDKFYISPYDELFHGFDKNKPKSESQLKEIAKHKRIARLRDDPDLAKNESPLWEDF